MVKCESLRINMFRITHTGKISKFSRNILHLSIKFFMTKRKKVLFVNGNNFDISSIWKVVKKIPVWIKYGERGKVKEQNLYIVSGDGGPFIVVG